MGEKVDTTWIVYALDGPAEPETLEAAIKRVVRHYGPQEFVEAVFALAPNQRLASRLHT